MVGGSMDAVTVQRSDSSLICGGIFFMRSGCCAAAINLYLALVSLVVVDISWCVGLHFRVVLGLREYRVLAATTDATHTAHGGIFAPGARSTLWATARACLFWRSGAPASAILPGILVCCVPANNATSFFTSTNSDSTYRCKHGFSNAYHLLTSFLSCLQISLRACLGFSCTAYNLNTCRTPLPC